MEQAEVVAELMLDGVVAEATVEPKPDRTDTRLAGPAVEDRVEANDVQVIVAVIVFRANHASRVAGVIQQLVVSAFRLGLVPRRRLGHAQHSWHQRRVDHELAVRIVPEKLVGAIHREHRRLVVQRVALAVGEVNANEQDVFFAGGPRYGRLLLGHRPQVYRRAGHLFGGDECSLPVGPRRRGIERTPFTGQRKDGLIRRETQHGFLGGGKLPGRLISDRHLPTEHNAVHRQAPLRAKMRSAPEPARGQYTTVERECSLHLAGAMPHPTTGNRHGVLRQPLGVLLEMLGDGLRQPDKARNGALQGQSRLGCDQSQHQRLTPLGQSHPLCLQARPGLQRRRLVTSNPLVKLLDRAGDQRRAGKGKPNRGSAAKNGFSDYPHKRSHAR